MTMRDTSYSALRDLEASGRAATRRAQILRCVCSAERPLSRREIARRSGLEIATVAGRVNELVADELLGEVRGSCPITGRRVHLVAPVVSGQQLQGTLFGAAGPSV